MAIEDVEDVALATAEVEGRVFSAEAGRAEPKFAARTLAQDQITAGKTSAPTIVL
jgi:hypothetical protein